MAKRTVLFVGETWNVTRIHTKGFDVVELGGFEDYSVYFKEPMKQFGDIEITHIPNHLVGSTFPRTPPTSPSTTCCSSAIAGAIP